MYESENLIVWRAKDTIQIGIKDRYDPELDDVLFKLTEISIEEGEKLLEELKGMVE